MLRFVAWVSLCSLIACGDDDDGGADSSTMGSDSGSDASSDAGTDADVGEDGGRDAGRDAGESITADAFCDFLVDAVCQWRACGVGDDCSTWPGSMFVSDACDEMRDAVEAGRLTFDGAAAADCVEELEVDCEAPPLGIIAAGERQGPASCFDAFQGTLEEGADCYGRPFSRLFYDDGCQDGYCSNDACPGTCQPWAALGEECGGSECDPSEGYCDGDTCVAWPQEGESCIPGKCPDGLSCRGAEDERVCVRPTADGESCDSIDDCRRGSVCVEGVCGITGPAGGDCWQSRNCPTDQYCDGGTCTDYRQENEDCDMAQCAEGLFCETTPAGGLVCVVPPVEGESCQFSQCAHGYWCSDPDPLVEDDQTCTAQKQMGESCLDGFGTTSGASNRCVAELVCVVTARMMNGVVTAAECQPVGDEGDPCDPGSSGRTCSEGHFCSRETATCAPTAVEDEPCHPGDSRSCADGFYCSCTDQPNGICNGYGPVHVAELCKPTKPNGEPCQNNEECDSSYCMNDANICADAPVNPALCEWP